MKHVWFLTIMHNTNTQQRIATSHHIWLLTSKLTKKMVTITTYFVIAKVTVANNVLLRHQTGFRKIKSSGQSKGNAGALHSPTSYFQSVQFPHLLFTRKVASHFYITKTSNHTNNVVQREFTRPSTLSVLLLMTINFQPKMHQISLGGRAPSGPAGRAYSTLPDPLAGLRGAYF